MTLAETIKKMGPPIPSNLHPNERAPVEQAAAPAERKPGKSALGASPEFTDYYGTGAPDDKTAGHNRDSGGENGSRFGASDSFKEAAEGYKPHIVVKAHSRFGPVGKQMLETHPAKNADAGAYEKARDLYLRSEDGGEAFEAYIKTLTPEQREYISNRLDEEGESEE